MRRYSWWNIVLSYLMFRVHPRTLEVLAEIPEHNKLETDQDDESVSFDDRDNDNHKKENHDL
jgi:hypothetical protein